MKNQISTYEKKLDLHAKQLEFYSKRTRLIVSIRLALAMLILYLGYICFASFSPWLLVLILLGIIGFGILIKLHAKSSYQQEIHRALVRVNKEEIGFLKNTEMPFEEGLEFKEEDHFYSHDLDFFGKKSLYQFLNRTQLFAGKKQLAQYLKTQPAESEIKRRQEAIKELSNELDWRQQFLATAMATKEKPETYSHLLKWSKQSLTKPNLVIRMLGFILPALLILSIILNYSYPEEIYSSLIQLLVLTNIGVAFTQVKVIRQELENSDSIKSSLKSYGLLLKQIEDKTFSSEKLTQLQSQLKINSILVSGSIEKLAKLYANLENINNPFGALLFNALTLYHVHALHSLKIWKQNQAKDIAIWMEVLGEFETLNSLANYTYNNSDFVFPSINSTEGIHFKDLGHPLIPSDKRINNTISFAQQSFIILTGSNMSGKSTFLRSLGVNMVLGQTGAPICASTANIQPMPVLVSMRVSDNLGEGESFFFAEVKRLKKIMEAAEKQTSFVLLDEILRGTNSDDKRTGTVEVIKNIISKNAIGAIATHDLKVCDTTAEYPNQLTNQCFEVEIKNDELVFDYKLREGVCKNKSATFLMKKMEVI